MSSRLPQVDAYIAKARPFAQPVLTLLREAVHHAAPEVEEQIKWSRPFFVLNGVILGNMSAFKEHCSFGLWGSEIVERLREAGINSSDGMGTFGKVHSIADLPPRPLLEAHIRHAAGLISSGTRQRSIQRVAKPGRTPELTVPEALQKALETNPAASAQFARFSPSCRREYIQWIEEAKREATRDKRISTALQWIAEGKSRNWKYETPA